MKKNEKRIKINKFLNKEREELFKLFTNDKYFFCLLISYY